MMRADPLSLGRQVRETVPVSPGQQVSRATRSASLPGKSFADVLGKQLESAQTVRFSAHAEQRLRQRAIQFDETAMQRISDSIDALGRKGARESLMLIDGTALLVNVPKRTVITALPAEEAGGNIFTNIDSAIVVKAADDATQKLTTA